MPFRIESRWCIESAHAHRPRRHDSELVWPAAKDRVQVCVCVELFAYFVLAHHTLLEAWPKNMVLFIVVHGTRRLPKGKDATGVCHLPGYITALHHACCTYYAVNKHS